MKKIAIAVDEVFARETQAASIGALRNEQQWQLQRALREIGMTQIALDALFRCGYITRVIDEKLADRQRSKGRRTKARRVKATAKKRSRSRK